MSADNSSPPPASSPPVLPQSPHQLALLDSRLIQIRAHAAALADARTRGLDSLVDSSLARIRLTEEVLIDFQLRSRGFRANVENFRQSIIQDLEKRRTEIEGSSDFSSPQNWRTEREFHSLKEKGFQIDWAQRMQKLQAAANYRAQDGIAPENIPVVERVSSSAAIRALEEAKSRALEFSDRVQRETPQERRAPERKTCSGREERGNRGRSGRGVESSPWIKESSLPADEEDNFSASFLEARRLQQISQAAQVRRRQKLETEKKLAAIRENTKKNMEIREEIKLRKAQARATPLAPLKEQKKANSQPTIGFGASLEDPELAVPLENLRRSRARFFSEFSKLRDRQMRAVLQDRDLLYSRAAAHGRALEAAESQLFRNLQRLQFQAQIAQGSSPESDQFIQEQWELLRWLRARERREWRKFSGEFEEEENRKPEEKQTKEEKGKNPPAEQRKEISPLPSAPAVPDLLATLFDRPPQILQSPLAKENPVAALPAFQMLQIHVERETPASAHLASASPSQPNSDPPTPKSTASFDFSQSFEFPGFPSASSSDSRPGSANTQKISINQTPQAISKIIAQKDSLLKTDALDYEIDEQSLTLKRTPRHARQRLVVVEESPPAPAPIISASVASTQPMVGRIAALNSQRPRLAPAPLPSPVRSHLSESSFSLTADDGGESVHLSDDEEFLNNLVN